MNNQVAQQVLHEVIKNGVKEFCVCPGSRNSPLVYGLESVKGIKIYYWPEERSAAFFALGRIKTTQRPVAVITTSGTAAGELLPATMEAHYISLPLILITADRPLRFRGMGAPQTAEQAELYGCYAHFFQDINHPSEICDLKNWTKQGPAHLNICFEEPTEAECKTIQLKLEEGDFNKPANGLKKEDCKQLSDFLSAIKHPLVVVSALNPEDKEFVIQFLLKLQAPVYAEAISGIREDSRLAQIRITYIDKIWQVSEKHKYPIDGILRIGGVPTARLWRDLEEREGAIKVCSISEHPFSGLSWSGVIHTSLTSFFNVSSSVPSFSGASQWLKRDQAYQNALMELFAEEPLAEPSLIHALSRKIGKKAKIYLGNSLPIREWDLAATWEEKGYQMSASRGLNGIDGQIATFYGVSEPHKENWGILGDLTALYDLVAPWILAQIPELKTNLVIVNNSGGQIFARMYAHPAFLHAHQLSFAPFADLWNIAYEKWLNIPDSIESRFKHRLIEIIPDAQATERFWKKMELL
jgi:2-succinyl-5-enolpyruvyl-6-hydroxy-3-cyclohexene-1-carboxylate synthase